MLPKWPQCLIKGKDVTPQQAMEIIARTDSFFNYGGNDHLLRRTVLNNIGFDVAIDDTYLSYTEFCSSNYEDVFIAGKALTLDYLSTNWITSSFIYGPNGFVSPDGKVSYYYNIGKWPSVDEVHCELKQIAEAFPFLEMSVVLMSGEWSEEDTVPVVGFEVLNGIVMKIDNVSDEMLNYVSLSKPYYEPRFSFGRECGLSSRQLTQFIEYWKSILTEWKSNEQD